jgi:hypothetical protein
MDKKREFEPRTERGSLDSPFLLNNGQRRPDATITPRRLTLSRPPILLLLSLFVLPFAPNTRPLVAVLRIRNRKSN